MARTTLQGAVQHADSIALFKILDLQIVRPKWSILYTTIDGNIKSLQSLI